MITTTTTIDPAASPVPPARRDVVRAMASLIARVRSKIVSQGVGTVVAEAAPAYGWPARPRYNWIVL